jgi:hypothetical protein
MNADNITESGGSKENDAKMNIILQPLSLVVVSDQTQLNSILQSLSPVVVNDQTHLNSILQSLSPVVVNDQTHLNSILQPLSPVEIFWVVDDIQETGEKLEYGDYRCDKEAINYETQPNGMQSLSLIEDGNNSEKQHIYKILNGPDEYVFDSDASCEIGVIPVSYFLLCTLQCVAFLRRSIHE